MHRLTIALCVASKRQTSRLSQIMVNLFGRKNGRNQIAIKATSLNI